MLRNVVLALALMAGAPLASATVFFEDRFATGLDAWVPSGWKVDDMGTWTHTAGQWFSDEAEAKGMATTDDLKHHAISAKMASEASTTAGKPLVVQFTVKHEKKDYSFCGGGYIKLLPTGLDQAKFGGDDEYAIMFGPDLCGYDVSRIHLIFNHEGKNLLKDEDIKLEYDDKDELTHLYTLIVEPDGTYQVLLDSKEKAAGKLSEGWAFPGETIEDPNESKPADWVDTTMIADPAEVKPEGYDDIPAEIADPEAEKPSDWDDEDDGEWEPPMVDNPDFKGPWSPTMIDNPDYKGEWVHPTIPNPAYAPATYAQYPALGYVGFELWTVNAGSVFDNVLVTDDKEYAAKAAEETFTKITAGEKEALDAWKAANAPPEPEAGEEGDFGGEGEEDLWDAPEGGDDGAPEEEAHEEL